MKALAVGSRHRCVVESFKKVIDQVLECIFEVEDLQKPPEENLNNIKMIISQVFEASNAYDTLSALPSADFIR